jgi:hypothetical protein
MSWVTSTIVLWSRAWRAEQLLLEAGANDRVHGAERLVHQQDGRVGGERPSDADPLLLAARRARRGSGRAARRRCPPARPARRPVRRCAPGPSRAAVAPWRCSGRWCGAGTARPAGSRSRCRRRSSVSGWSRMSTPPMLILPAVGSMRRLIIRSVVVLPQPDGPMSTVICPRGQGEVERGDGGLGGAREGLGDGRSSMAEPVIGGLRRHGDRGDVAAAPMRSVAPPCVSQLPRPHRVGARKRVAGS